MEKEEITKRKLEFDQQIIAGEADMGSLAQRFSGMGLLLDFDLSPTGIKAVTVRLSALDVSRSAIDSIDLENIRKLIVLEFGEWG